MFCRNKNLVAIILAVFLSVSFCFAQTIISDGIISQHTRWTADESPYILTNDVVVEQQARLVIDPGVEILIEKPIKIPSNIEQVSVLDSFTVKITINGALHAIGTPTSPIIFRGKDIENPYTHWFGIVIDSRKSQEVSIGYTIITSAANGITVNSGIPFIRNTLFEFNNVGLRLENRADARVFHCVFSQNYLAGIRVVDSNPFIYNSILINNNMLGLWGDKNTEIAFKNNLAFGNGRNFSDTDPRFGRNTRTNANGDSTDFAGNLVMDPIFIENFAAQNAAQNAGKRQKLPMSQSIINEIKDQRYFLSPFSPCIDAGIGDRGFRETDGSLPDMGIWGGAEVIKF
ncbi:MAG: right-handed parallel beta-helix repeat-containing protein [Chitinivibrionia bacterium]|nr:right-handed parallel beta-helix repeat-containing protein [Chitinivibrionia bacterium]